MIVSLILAVGCSAASDYRRKDICPTLTCSSFLDSTQCGSLDYSDYSYLIQPCGFGYSCPAPNLANTKDQLMCQVTTDLYGNSYSTGMELYLRYHNSTQLALVGVKGGMVIRTLGDICYSPNSWCDRTQGVTCQCKDQCRCVAAGGRDAHCSESQAGEYPGCAWGLSCYQGYCTDWFSITASVVVSDVWLCASMQLNGDGSCAPADSTMQDITLPCVSHADCYGANGLHGTCQCGLLGFAYCSPMSQDAPYSSLKAAIVKADTASHAYWRMVVDNWAFLQRADNRGGWVDHPQCVSEVWPILKTYFRELTYHEDLQTAFGSLIGWSLFGAFLVSF